MFNKERITLGEKLAKNPGFFLNGIKNPKIYQLAAEYIYKYLGAQGYTAKNLGGAVF